MQPLDVLARSAGVGLVVDHQEGAAGLHRGEDAPVELARVHLAVLADQEVVVVLRDPREVHGLGRGEGAERAHL